MKKSSPKTLPVMQQVQIMVGCMILTGTALALWVSLWGLVLCLIAGVGLVRAGFTGVCPMENMLHRMPWNKAQK